VDHRPGPADRAAAGPPPKLLALAAEIPDVEGYWVRVTLNGSVLFHDKVEQKSTWSAELPLDRVDLGDRAVIELESPTFVPARLGTGSKDPRTLGVHLTRLLLLSQAAAEKP
jgi:hypothetical protein